MKKRIWLLSVLTLAALLFTGCAARNIEEMYALPRRSEEYNHLQTTIDSAMYGMSYSAPRSGDNQQTVQLADLDGDGVDEYLVFAKGATEKPLQVIILRQESNGKCRIMEVISSNGTAFEQVEYAQLDDNPGCELIIGRQLSDQVLRSVSVYTFTEKGAELLLMNGYAKFQTCDLDEDGLSELLVLRPGESESERGMAVLYSAKGGNVQRSVETELSEDTKHIRRILAGRLQDGKPAVFVSSAVDESAIVTDIFAMQDGRFTNIAFSSEADTSVRTLSNFYIYADDVDGDGILEIPSLLTMKAVSEWKEEEQKYLIRWFAMDSQGSEVDKLFTFHNYVGGWYIQLDNSWASRVSVEQGANTYSFYVWDETYEEAALLFTLYVFTGSSRDEDAVRDGRFALYRAEGVAYAAELDASAAAQYAITEDHLIDSFRLIQQDRRTGES